MLFNEPYQYNVTRAKKEIIIMLIAGIIALVAEYVILGLISFNIYETAGFLTPLYIMLAAAIFCTTASIIVLVSGIKGIKDKRTRGQSIATAAVGGLGGAAGLGAIILIGFILFIYFGLESRDGDGSFHFVLTVINNLYL